MGGFLSRPDTSAQERSDEIDRQIEEDRQCFRRECNILVLGTSCSGKTTIINYISALAESSTFVSAIHRDFFDSAYQLVEYMKKAGLECADNWNQLLAEEIYKHVLPTPISDDRSILTPEIAQAIHKLWMDPIIRKVMDERRSDLCLMDSASYFFDEVLRIGAPGYIPNETDVQRVCPKTSGTKEVRIRLGSLLLNLLDVGGQPTERMKWIHCFERVESIIYCVRLDYYNQVLLKDKTQTRMHESLLLFESVVNSRWFLRTSVILFMTKTDKFKTSLKTDPLDRYFPEYTGGDDINKAAEYILRKFKEVNRARLTIYPLLVQAMNPSILNWVFVFVKETILQNALKDSGIL